MGPGSAGHAADGAGDATGGASAGVGRTQRPASLGAAVDDALAPTCGAFASGAALSIGRGGTGSGGVLVHAHDALDRRRASTKSGDVERAITLRF
jgi:hypothetical protein